MHRHTQVGIVLDEIRSYDNWRTANGTVLGRRLLRYRDLHTATRYNFSIQTYLLVLIKAPLLSRTLGTALPATNPLYLSYILFK